MPTKLALFGDPVMHSLSPRIHTEFAKQFSLDLDYQRILTPKGDLTKTLAIFKRAGGLGGNITVPIKKEAYALCQIHSLHAQHAGAVNTFWWDGDKLKGENTDGRGFLYYIGKHLGEDPTNKRILLLGAGGAASALVSMLSEQPIQALSIVNRNIEHAEELAERHEKFKAFGYEEFNNQVIVKKYDWVINATSCSLQNKIPKLNEQWISDTTAIDLSYCGGEPTIFMTWAKRHNAQKIEDGLGMLVEQAALSFQCWLGKTPDTFPVLSNLRARE
jgi:shikimate dehydrogenase